MPVDDIPVHSSVRQEDGAKYGCFNKPRTAEGYYALNRHYFADGRFEVRNQFIEHQNTRDCRSFHMWAVDPMCGGCTVPKDQEYAKACLARIAEAKELKE